MAPAHQLLQSKRPDPRIPLRLFNTLTGQIDSLVPEELSKKDLGGVEDGARVDCGSLIGPRNLYTAECDPAWSPAEAAHELSSEARKEKKGARGAPIPEAVSISRSRQGWDA